MIQHKRWFAAAKRILLGGLNMDEMPLMEMETYSVSWKKSLAVEIPSSMGISHGVKEDYVGNKVAVRQQCYRSQRSSIPSSASIRKGVQGDTHTLLAVRHHSETPRLHAWSPTTIFLFSMIVGGITIGMIVTLVRTSPDKNKGGVPVADHQPYSSHSVVSVGSDVNETSASPVFSSAVASDSKHEDMTGADRKQEDEGPSSRDEHKRSAYTSPRELRSSTFGSVVWWNDDGFGPQPSLFLSPKQQPRQLVEDHQRGPVAQHQEKPSTAEKGTMDIERSSDKEEGVDEYRRRKRLLGRPDRKSYLKSVDLRKLRDK